MHSFNDSEKMARRIMEKYPNGYFGISGMITNPKSKQLRSIVQSVIPINRILLETDAPYLPPSSIYPTPKYSTPAHTLDIAQEISFLTSIPLPLLLPILRENTRQMYSI